MKKAGRTLLIIIVAGVIFFGQRWYSYVNNKTSPYDEVGIQINSAMPGPIRKWGCDKLHANFASALPPYGCQAPDGKSWI
ncbi:hypothetical protein [Hyphomicrobium sp.]|jgi:hypothetical protein|uniref:hypothetical protein n=1 Tax=Hyphomicrobium sp. TaxID=82 RepID=UPI0035616CE0